MKKIFTILTSLFLGVAFLLPQQAQAQVPEGISYQAILRDLNGNVIQSRLVGMQISVLQGSPTGTAVYVETQAPTTNANGLISLEIGSGTVQTGSFASIDWANGPHFIKAETDPTGGTNYSLTGTSQLLSVPYALHAKTAQTLASPIIDNDTLNEIQSLSLNNDTLSLNKSNSVNLNPYKQTLSVSVAGDTLYLQNGGFVIIPGISAANAPVQLATLTTSAVSSLTNISATSGGNITDAGGANITTRGVCYSINTNPTTADNITNDGNGTGSFTSNLSGLTASTTYYVRAYAINSAGTAYGNEVSFTTTACGGCIYSTGAGVTFNGYTYTSIVLGNGQEWMAENLRTTTYANGELIPNVTDGTQWSNLTTGAWAHYNNNNQYENSYGKLYNWYTVADPRNVCPTGWHVPTDAEYTLLTDYLGGGSVAGGKMKSTGTQYWSSPNSGATNESGFSGLPGGFRDGFSGSFSYIGKNGYWWSSTEGSTNGAWNRNLIYYDGDVNRYSTDKGFGFSVRCLRD